jgi:hypothetical protein
VETDVAAPREWVCAAIGLHASCQLIPIAALAITFTSAVATPAAAHVSGIREVSASADHVIPITCGCATRTCR